MVSKQLRQGVLKRIMIGMGSEYDSNLCECCCVHKCCLHSSDFNREALWL